ncbi:AraC family transcriptional regulator [Schumannella soli]|uniref:AraC family transcriptional regulator n=1 Tax=Schumannella soli TaxID=2590779 RepID=A0A506YAT5_9MICO|nr:AraC family transcriptional regulator [Schumannella soli]TPW77589.1 AraC family transcriptional regulator [Schumannella soli]
MSGAHSDAAAPSSAERLRAWSPGIPGMSEVLHARFVEHAYPLHAHGDWSLLLIDQGEVRYELDGRQHRAPAGTVTLLPPRVPHDGHAASTREGFRKRVAYLDRAWLPEQLVSAASARPLFDDPALIAATRRLHALVALPGEAFRAESELAGIGVRLRGLLAAGEGGRMRARLSAVDDAGGVGLDGAAGRTADAPLALRLRELLEAEVAQYTGSATAEAHLTLAAASRQLGASPEHLIRVFRAQYGVPPHRYLTSIRVDRARRLLLGGMRAVDAAIAAGFYDQAHLTRHFRRVLGTTPTAFQRSAA